MQPSLYSPVPADATPTAFPYRIASIYARNGWSVIPLHGVVAGRCTCPPVRDGKPYTCHSQGKHPRLRDWVDQASKDTATLARWAEEFPIANLGIATGSASGFFVLDVDPKNGGDVTLARLEEQHGPLPVTATQATPSGGFHYLFKMPDHGVTNRRVGQGLDIRGNGGQIVAAPSRTHAGMYRWTRAPWDTEIAVAPAWLLARLAAGPALSSTRPLERGTFPPATPDVLANARTALVAHGPAIEGQSGGLHAVHAGMLLTHDFALTDAESEPLLLEWNRTCVPPYEPAELFTKALRNGRKYGRRPFGCRRTTDNLEIVRTLVSEWAATAGSVSDAERDNGMRELLAEVRLFRFDATARALVVRLLMGATGLRMKDLDLPPAVNMQEMAERAKRRQDFESGAAPDLIDPTEPLGVARCFLDADRDADGLPALARWQGSFWLAHGTHYTERSDEAISADLYRFTDGKRNVVTGAPVKPDRAMVETLAHALKAAAAVEVSEAPAWLGGQAANDTPPADVVAFRNGLLHVPTRHFEPPTRRFFNMNALAFDYAPSAPAPAAWLAFLEQVWPGDVEAKETLQEVFGLALTGDTSFQKMFLLVGPKRSGKGTVARVLQALVGPGNFCAPTLNGLGTQFGLESLIGKTLAVISDARLSGRTDLGAVTENLLRVSGEDTVTVPRKHRTDWTARLRVRFIILSNEVPALVDQSGALASRFVMLTTRRSFFGNEDRGLDAKLSAELPGIMHWALAGLDRLRMRGHFRQPASAAEAVRQLETLGSPVKAFFDDRCELAPGREVPCATLYGEWIAWCSVNGKSHPGTVQMFGRDLASAFPAITTARPRDKSGQQVKVYVGISLKAA
ncbi:phage/plasmid primase, P4 family [Archangium violaceum]|uniref:phage/plasmid primase, P4 family n=1 Tax=Archangium violaceum TaxID=83451 RepID=UPI0036D7DD12